MDACEILHTAVECIGDRAKDRDLPDGERSMLRAVAAFEALTKVRISETQGWLFMGVLKMARATAGRHRADDWIDGAGYMALAGESAERDNQPPVDLHWPARNESASALAAALIEAAERDE